VRPLGTAIASGLLLALAGCAGLGLSDLTRAPDRAVPTTPALATHWLVADDGAQLPLRIWLPDGPVRATILALHGFNDYSEAFTAPAQEWAKHGIATYAYDQRGFGQAPDHGLWPGIRRLDQDMAVASRLVARQHPGVPHYILGESMGGAVVITGMAGAADAPRPVADGVILAAPAVWGRDEMTLFERVALWTAYHMAPGLTFTGEGLGIQPSDNIPMLRLLAHDPLVIKATRVDAIEGLVDLMDRAQAAAPRLDARLLLLYGAHDELIPPDAVRYLLATMPADTAAERRIAWYPEGFHMILRDLDAAIVVADVESWVLDPAAPLPSGADHNLKRIVRAGE
jgi:alpha-beta hydrolase superfamily lysophospholipase